jgi:hypothetical protein
MEIRISVAEGDLADLESLDKWLRGEPELAGHVRLAARPPAKGTLGPLTDALIATVSAGGTATVLARALSVWLAHRPRVRIKFVLPDGTSMEIGMDNGTGQVDVEAVIRRTIDVFDSWHARDAATDAAPAALGADATGTGEPAEPAAPEAPDSGE